jgi:hypothetical protein
MHLFFRKFGINSPASYISATFKENHIPALAGGKRRKICVSPTAFTVACNVKTS